MREIQYQNPNMRESFSNIKIQIFFFSRTACREIRYQNPNMFCLSVNIGRNWGWWNWRTSSRSEVAELNHLSWNQDPGAKWAKGCTGIFVTVQKDHPGPVHFYYCTHVDLNKSRMAQKWQHFMCLQLMWWCGVRCPRLNRGNQWLLSWSRAKVAIAINTTEPSIQPTALFLSSIWDLNWLWNLEVPQCSTQRPYENIN